MTNPAWRLLGLVWRHCLLSRPAASDRGLRVRTAGRRPRRRGDRWPQLSPDDGREIRLAGIEPAGTDSGHRSAGAVGPDRRPRGHAARRGRHAGPLRPAAGLRFSRIAPRRRCRACCCAQGEALVSADIADKDCAAALAAAEAEARQAKRGIWADPAAIKNAESPDDILAGIGRFTVVEGRVCRSGRRGRQLISISDGTGHGTLR